MSRSINEIQRIDLAIASLVLQRRRLGLDGDAAFLLDIHGIKDLRGHLAIGEATTALYQAVSQSRLAMVDMSDDGKIADVIHIPGNVGLGKSQMSQRLLVNNDKGSAQGVPLRKQGILAAYDFNRLFSWRYGQPLGLIPAHDQHGSRARCV